MLESLSLTQNLAILVAIYMGAAGIGLLTDSKSFTGLMDEFQNNITLTYLGAILAFVIGATIITLHNVWDTPLQIIVSALGWAAFIEGVLMLALRRPFFTLVGAIPLNEAFLKLYGAFCLLVASALIILSVT